MGEHTFTNRLDDFRRNIRRRLVAYGVLAVASGGVAAFVTVIFLDWALGLPPLLRLVGGLLFLLGFIGASYFWIVKPLRARVTVEELAWRLEQRFPELRDQLLSAVEFTKQSAEPSTMSNYTIAQAEQAVEHLPLQVALTNRPILARALGCGAAACLLLVMFAMIPGWIQVGTARYSSPWGQAQWPKTVAIVPVTQDIAVPVGESAQVIMRVEHGLTPKLRPVVHLRRVSGHVESLALQQQADGRFVTTIDAITEDMHYWFEAGDDDTSQRMGRLLMVRRPQVVNATATIYAPPYAESLASRVVDLAKGTMEATVGSRIVLALQINKPLPSGQAGLRADGDLLLPLLPLDDRNTVVCEFELREDVVLQPELRDEHGFTNHGATAYRMKAVSDRPPSVAIGNPKGMLEITPSAEIELQFQVTDDFGISDVALEWNAGGSADPRTASLAKAGVAQQYEELVRFTGTYTWNLTPLGLTPGELVNYHVAASDNRVLPEAPEPQRGVSASRQLKIIAETELLSQLREDLLLVESQLRQVTLNQEAVNDRTEEIATAVSPSSGLPEESWQFVESLAGRQSRLAEKSLDLVQRLEKVSARLTMNRTSEGELEALIHDAAVSLQETADERMAEAARSLESMSAAQPQEQGKALARAGEEQRDALKELKAVGRKLAQWGSFQSLVARTRDLLDRQSDVRDDTRSAGRSLMGKQLGSLTEAEHNQLKELERRQRQIVADLDQHLAQMREHQQSLAPRDAAGAETIDAALRAERANATTDHAKNAADAIGENRTAAADIEQRSTMESMRKLISALQERQKRELEELRKQVAEAEEQVAWLIEHQKSLLSATSEAGVVGATQETFVSLAEQQGTLAQNTTFAADDLAAAERTAAISGVVEQAVEPMQAARTHLDDAAADTAAKAQQDAIELLEEALAELRKLDDAAAEEWLRHSLSRIHDHLETMLDGQRGVDSGIGELRAELQATAKIGRAQARRVTQLAREQTDVRALLTEVLPDLQAVPVYAWALDRVAKWMDTSSNKLIARQIDHELADTSSRIVRELEKLVQAIIDTQDMPMDEEFMEAEAASGGSQGQSRRAGTGPPVPTVAELLVLKAMQQDVASRTAEFSTSFDATKTSEEQLKALSQLGEDQAELRRLTEMVTEKARMP
jgi:hypothetical protein